MVEVYKLMIYLAIALVILIIITSALMIKSKKEFTDIVAWVLGEIIISLVVYMLCVIPASTYYIDGTVVKDIKSAHLSGEAYDVETKSGEKYAASIGKTCDDTFLSLDCKIVTKSIIGFETYKTADIIFVKKEGIDDMSESEKQSVLDRTTLQEKR